ncbi:FAD-binding oxidoreductase [Streptomyces sp. NBC_00338]|uniref:NAD(P)/FAD-dependent oxidoreductase n=1 Tax=Streptomyces sp. NBC_00338 TaxID=2975715 RepID=UPI002254AB71|nr:FAD-dependent oxidoreductase [Streptomyces sp. NBC_00338]MCX5141189.1 FAD-binding oxidoreductase [Streptomyces sp. NBC_00338]
METADIAIVGAGIAGVMIAREVVRRDPGLSVLVVERDAVASGASRRSAGLHFPRGATERVRRMTAYSQDFYRTLREQRSDVPIHDRDMYVVAALESEPGLREVHLPDAAPAAADPKELVVAGSPVLPPAGCGVWSVAGCQYADVPGLTRLLARELRPGVRFLEGVRVTAVEPGTSSVALRLGSGDTVTAGRVVLAPGPWLADPAWGGLVEPLGARVKKVVALHVERQPEPDAPVVSFHDEDAFLLPLGYAGHWLFSYTCREWDVDPDELRAGLLPRDLAEAREVLGRYAPDLAGNCVSGRVFCDAYSTTAEPLIRSLDPYDRVVFAGAANGSGYRLAPATAAETADLLGLPSGPAYRRSTL